MTEIAASQLGIEEGYTPDPEIAKVVKRLPRYLQPVVTLMAMMVPLIEESKMRNKGGQEVSVQAISIVLTVSIFVYLDLHQVIVDHLSNDLFLFPFLERHSDDLGA